MPGCAAQVHVTATRASTSGRPQMGHIPAFSDVTVVWIGQIHDVSSRTGTRLILQIGHDPGCFSSTSGCIGQVIDNGGTAAFEAGVPRCAETAATTTSTNSIAMALTRWSVRESGVPAIRVMCTATDDTAF